jgi:pimeloyl-ACP methyl ester carboxylesterase
MTWRSGRAIVNHYVAKSGERRPIELAYDSRGDGPAIVLVMGLNAQRIFWEDGFCARLAGEGFRVIRFDHRDTGESTHLDVRVPRLWRTVARRFAGATVDVPYTLSDMARDVVGLLDALALPRAHVVGASLGGMVGQHLAIDHAPRLASLVVMMTSPGGRRFVPEPRVIRAMLAPAPRDAAGSGEHVARLFAEIGSPKELAHDAARWRALGELAYRRGASARGFLRQLAAVLASGDREARLRDVRTPTLVVHGTRDPMLPLAAGRTISRALPGAAWLPVAGMGHDVPEALWPMLTRAIVRHVRRAEA